jgi:hypothetical protein
MKLAAGARSGYSTGIRYFSSFFRTCFAEINTLRPRFSIVWPCLRRSSRPAGLSVSRFGRFYGQYPLEERRDSMNSVDVRGLNGRSID